jgi:short-subunit dehydrogenase
MGRRVEPKRALITGASSGLGAALAQRLAARGIEVWLVARRAELLAQQVERIHAAGGRAHALALDVNDADATYARMAKLDEEVGGIDLVVANAGVGGARGGQGLVASSWPDVKDFIQINMLGAVATLAPFVSRMAARGHGQLVGISSVAADIPNPRNAAYGSGKAGLTFFLECADIELRPLGIDVTIIHPGFVKTPLILDLNDPMPLLMSEEKAIDIIDRSIRLRKRLVRFPWIMGAISRLAAALPRWMMSPLIRKAVAARPRASRPAGEPPRLTGIGG